MNVLEQPVSDSHLSDDQLEELLLGPADDATIAPLQAHVGACALCRARQEAFTGVVANFNQATLDWSRARVETPMRAAVPSSPKQRFRLFSAPAYAFAATLLVLLTLVFSRFLPHHGEDLSDRLGHTHQPVAISPLAGDQAASAPASPAAQIAADNNLLADIDSALDQPDPAPISTMPIASDHSLAPQPGSTFVR